MGRPTIAILASGNGSTAEAFIRASATGKVQPTVGLVICNKAAEKAGIWQRIANLNQEFNLATPIIEISRQTHPAGQQEQLAPGDQTEAEETALLEALVPGNFDAIILMGYMKKIGPRLVQALGWQPTYSSPYQARLLNTHPGPLPEVQGLFGIHIQEYVLTHHLPYSAQTLHVVSEHYDDGPTVAEHRVEVKPTDTPDTLFARVQAIEKAHLPKDIETFIKQRSDYLKEA